MSLFKFKLSLKIISKYLIFFTIIFAISFLLFHFAFYGTASLVLLLLIIVVLVVLLIAGIKRAFKEKKYTIMTIVVLSIPILVLSLFLSCKLMDYESRLTETKAKLIVNALDKYYVDNEIYPKDISQLVPNYLEEIPQTSMLQGNKKFEYYKADDGGYILQYYYGYTLKELYNGDDSWHLCPRG